MKPVRSSIPMHVARRQMLATTTNVQSLQQAKAVAQRRIDDALTIGLHVMAVSWQVDLDITIRRLEELGRPQFKEAA